MHKKEQEIIIEKQKPRIELYYKYNYKGIENFTYTDFHTIPTGTYIIEGYVNNDPELDFTAMFDPGTNFESEGSESDKLGNLAKPEYTNQTKTVSEILKEQKESLGHKSHNK